MISTRLHGMIDYGVALLLGGLARSRALPPPVRRVVGTASVYHTSYAMLTDYEGGLLPRLTMRQHLALDALGGIALCAAGVAMRRQPGGARALLVGAGLAELAVVALTSTEPGKGTASADGEVGYPLLDTPKPVAEDVFVVDSVLPGLMGRVLPVRMTVFRLPDGGLLLHSPTRFSRNLQRELEKLGRIRHLVAPNVAHWTFLKEWQRACPDVTTWAAPGLRERSQVRRSGVRLDHDLTGDAPAEWDGTITLDAVPGGLGFREMVLFHQPSRTLVLTDLVMNLEAPKVPAVMRPLALLFGMMAPDGMPPPYLRAVVRLRRRDAARAASRLLGLMPERVVFAHGRWFGRDATAALRRSWRWLLD
jgi:hypothetical protein